MASKTRRWPSSPYASGTAPVPSRARIAAFSSCLHSAPPHSGPQLRTSRTVDGWVWLGATEGDEGRNRPSSSEFRN